MGLESNWFHPLDCFHVPEHIIMDDQIITAALWLRHLHLLSLYLLVLLQSAVLQNEKLKIFAT